MDAHELTIDLAAGGIAGLVADAATHPVDTVRTRLWSQDHPSTSGYRYRGLWHGLVDMAKKEGVGSLFKGFGSVVLLTPAAHGLYFASYEWSKAGLRGIRDKRLRPSEGTTHLLAGFFANGVGGLIWTPMDVVKQRQQAVVRNLYGGAVDGLVSIWRSHGFFNGLQRGYWSGMATYGPFSAIYFMIYEWFKTACIKHEERRRKGSVGILREGQGESLLHEGHFIVGGFLAGTVAAIATAPIDLVKTRMQVFDGCGYDGMVSTTLKIVREEGLAVFGRGLMARIIWIAPGCSLTIAVYEDVRKVLHHLIPVSSGASFTPSARGDAPVLIRHRASGKLSFDKLESNPDKKI